MLRNKQIASHIAQAICEVLGIDDLYGGNHQERQPNGYWINKYRIEYLWVATLRRYWWNDVTVGIAERHDKQQELQVSRSGFLFVSGWEENSFQGTQPFRSIALDNIDDPILQYLRQVNIVPPVQEGSIPDDPESSASFEIHTFVESSCSSLSFAQSSLPSDGNGRLLWKSLIDLCDKFALLNGDPKIAEYIKRSRILDLR